MRKKWILAAVLLACALSAALSRPAAAGEANRRKLTLMIYMCGSNLESAAGSATGDLMEMMKAEIGSDISVLVMTGGTSRWAWNLSLSGRTAIHEIAGHQISEVWSSGTMNMGDPDTLRQLLAFGQKNRPADGYALLLWNHGAGPLEGVCWDELFSMDRLTLKELTDALRLSFLPGKLRWIGFDACLMADAEVAAALSPYADYMIASQETEPATGWNYAFLSGLSGDESGAETGRHVIDSYFESLSASRDRLTLSCIDLSKMDTLLAEIDRFFDPLSKELNEESFPQLSASRMSAGSFGENVRSAGNEGYDLVDLRELARQAGPDIAGLQAALEEAVVCSRSSGGEACGLSVYHPYYNKDRFLARWDRDYQGLYGFSPSYRKYVRSFGTLLTGKPLVDWSGLETADEGFDENGDHRFSLALTEDQRKHLASAELYILQRFWPDSDTLTLSPVSVSAAAADGSGRLSAVYRNRGLYILDEQDKPLAGPICYELGRETGSVFVRTVYRDDSGKNPERDMTGVIHEFEPDPDSGDLNLLRRYVYDSATQSYTNRLAFTEEGMTDVEFHYILRNLPEGQAELPGFDSWEMFSGYSAKSFRLPLAWHLRFEEHQGHDLYAMFLLTDVNRNVWSSRPVRIRNPHETDLPVSPAELEAGGSAFRFSLTLDPSGLQPRLQLRVETENRSDRTLYYRGTPFLLNGSRLLSAVCLPGQIRPGETKALTCILPPEELSGLQFLDSVDFSMEIQTTDFDENIRVPLHLEIGRCDLSGVAPPLPPALAEGEADGLSAQLLSLMQDADGSFRAGFLVRNTGNGDFSGDVHVFFDRVKVGESRFIDLPAHTECLLSLWLRNQDTVFLTSLNRDYGGDEFHAVLGQAAEQAGVRAVETVDLYLGMDDSRGTEGHRVRMVLAEPFPLQAPDPLPCEPAELLAGDVSVRLEFVLIGESGIGLGLRLSNDSDRAVPLEVLCPVLNASDYSAFSSYDRLVLPAHTQAVKCLHWSRLNVSEGSPAETLQFVFSFSGLRTSPVLLSFPEGTLFGAPQGTLLNADRITVVPAVR